MSADSTNAERQARWRAKQLRVEDIARALFATFAGEPDNKGEKIASRWLALIAEQARKTVPAQEPRPVQWCTPAQVKRRFQFMPKGLENYHGMANWLGGHKDRVIEIIIFPISTGDPLDPAEQMLLAKFSGIYRIARLDRGGSFGRDKDCRPQVRALMAVTERALQDQPLTGGWASAASVIYDPRKPVT